MARKGTDQDGGGSDNQRVFLLFPVRAHAADDGEGEGRNTRKKQRFKQYVQIKKQFEIVYGRKLILPYFIACIS